MATLFQDQSKVRPDVCQDLLVEGLLVDVPQGQHDQQLLKVHRFPIASDTVRGLEETVEQHLSEPLR